MDNSGIRSIDVLVLLKLATTHGRSMSTRRLAESLGMSKSSVSLSVSKLKRLHILRDDGVNRLMLQDLLEHAIKWIAPAEIGERELGIPTSHSADPLRAHIRSHNEDCLVMPLPHGPTVGRAVPPIHSLAPQAAQKDPNLHKLLALADAFRIGRARERELASKELRQCL